MSNNVRFISFFWQVIAINNNKNHYTYIDEGCSLAKLNKTNTNCKANHLKQLIMLIDY